MNERFQVWMFFRRVWIFKNTDKQVGEVNCTSYDYLYNFDIYK